MNFDRMRLMASATAFAVITLGMGPALAADLTLSGVTVSLNPAQNSELVSVNEIDPNPADDTNPHGDTGVLAGGGTITNVVVNDQIGASTRYTAADSIGANSTANSTYSYNVTFDVSADPGVIYDVDVSHDLEGSLETVAIFGCQACKSQVSDVTATIVSGPVAGGQLIQAAATNAGPQSDEQDIGIQVSRADAAIITFTGLSGSHTISIDFVWTGFLESSTLDSASMRFGLQPGSAGYGSPGQSGGGDGHFVDITATVTTASQPVCGDGNLDAGEECDDGNLVDGDGCDAACVIEFCGDGITQAGIGEQCDDGGTLPGDGCDELCQLEVPECGDGNIDPGEQCDDGNLVNEDGCSSSCQLEVCGDGVVQVALGEQCDDGNTNSDDGCDAFCQDEFCGDGITQGGLGETCDDGNLIDEDGCSSTCQAEICVDGIILAGLGE